MMAGTDAPFEIRAMPPQANTGDFTLMAELIEKRVAFLKQQAPEGEPIHFVNISKDLFSGEQVASRFYVYVVEAGGDWDHFKNLLRPVAREFQPDIFLTGAPDWKNPAYAEALENNLRFIPTSKFLRDRIRTALQDKGAVRVSGSKILDNIQNAAKSATDPFEKKAYEDLIQDVVRSKPWASEPARLPKILQTGVCDQSFARIPGQQ